MKEDLGISVGMILYNVNGIMDYSRRSNICRYLDVVK